jgi:Ca-activated chloride channel family protein
MRIKTLLLVVLLCLALVPVVSMPRAQDPAPAPPQTGPMVGLSLIVTDKDGKGVTSIRKDQIRVVEDGAEQTVLGIETDERPVDYVVVFDASGSTKRFLLAVLDAAKLLIQNRRPEDQVAIVRFVNSDTIEKVHEFSSDVTSLLKELDSSTYVGGGQSAVVDALYLSTQYVAEQNKANDARRKAVVIMTDGEDRSSYYTQEKLVKLLRETGAQVIDLDQQGSFARSSPRHKAETLLNTVAEESGGRVFYPTDKKEFVEATTQIILDLRAQFRIKYQSTRDPSKKGFRKVDVKYVAAQGDEKRNVITPRGYFIGPPTPPDKKSEKKKKS